MHFNIQTHLLMTLLLVSDGREQYGCCAKYRNNETYLSKAGYDRFCLPGPGREKYCKEWKCPYCRHALTEKCKSCKGTCQNGGRIFKYGDSILSVDGVNTCFCSTTGEMGCTEIGPNIDVMCNSTAGCKDFKFITLYFIH